jgi:DNA polymerase
MRLPNGRLLAYCRPFLKTRNTPIGEKEVVHFWGVDGYTKQWCEQTTYGGKLAENATQAVARDIMAEAMLRVECAGYPVILSVHDELITEVPKGTGDVELFERTMAALPAWAGGLPVAAAGWKGERYRK